MSKRHLKMHRPSHKEASNGWSDRALRSQFPIAGRSLNGADFYRPGPKAAAWSDYIADDLRLCGVEVTIDRTLFTASPVQEQQLLLLLKDARRLLMPAAGERK